MYDNVLLKSNPGTHVAYTPILFVETSGVRRAARDRSVIARAPHHTAATVHRRVLTPQRAISQDAKLKMIALLAELGMPWDLFMPS